MNFPNNAKKSTQAVARLIKTSGGPQDYLRVSKLIYLADRQSILERGIPIIGGHYLSMRKGPTISEFMDFVNARNAPGWKEAISPRHGNEVRLCETYIPEYGALSESELKILDSTVNQHRTRTTEELVEWCHENCPEYEGVSAFRRKPILVEAILRGGNKSDSKIQKVIEEAKEIEELDNLLK